MKLLLVNPYFGSRVYAPTLGLGFLATYLKKKLNCQVEVVEPVAKELNEQALLKKVKTADYLGLTCYTESRFLCFDFALKAKAVNPKCQIIAGGPHATALDRQILEHYPFVDIIVRGEGEEAILKILRGELFSKIDGITWRYNNKIIRNPDQILKENIEQFCLDYSLIYPEIKNWKDREVPYRLQRLNNLPIIASRGCPFKCSFCGSNRHWAGLWRGVSPENLVKKLATLVNKYKIGYFRFYDALFIGSDDQIFRFCDALEHSKLRIKFRIDIRVGTKKEVLKRLREVGCEVVGFGIESGSDKILKRINKGITRKQVEETIDICRSLNYWMVGYFMISLPDETRKDFQKSAELFHFFDIFNLQFFKIHPHTTFYEELKKRGEINDEIWFDKKYGEEIFYSKELFPNVNFYYQEIQKNIKQFYLTHSLRKPLVTIRRYGWVKSIFYLILSLMQIILIQHRVSTKLLEKIRRSKLGKLFKSRFFIK